MGEHTALVVGCGSIGRRHLQNLAAREIRGLRAFDPDPERLAVIERELRVTTSLDIDEAYQGVDMAVICSPPASHIDQGLDAIARGCHVLIEKPLAADLDGVSTLIAAADAQMGQTVMVAANFRFDPAVRHARSLIQAGAVGEVRSVRLQFGQYLPEWHPSEDYRQGYSASRRLGGGVILDRIHEIDLMRWLLGEPVSVYCAGGKLSDLEIETEDVGEMILRFQSGAVGSIHVDYLRGEYDCSGEAVAAGGVAMWTFQDHTVRWKPPGGALQSLEFPDATVNTMYEAQLDHFVRCIEGLDQPDTTLENGVANLRVAGAAHASLSSGGVVVL